MPEQGTDPLDRIRGRLEELSPNDQRVADAVLRDPTGVAFMSADALATAAGVSKAAVVRFGARLGYGGYTGLQEALRGDIRGRLEDASAPATGETLVQRWLEAVERDLRTVATATPPEVLDRAAALLESGAKSVTAYVSHGVLSGGAVARVDGSALAELVVTDSIAATAAVKAAQKVRRITIAPLLAEAMRRTAEESSVSSLFD